MLKAGFADVDITPPLGTDKIGWLIRLVSDQVLDPLFARVAVIETGEGVVGFVQLDTLSIRWTTTQEIRRRIEAQYGIPGDRVMVSATHNHAGPAVAAIGEVHRDEAYLETLIARCVAAFGQALEKRQPAEIGFGHAVEFGVAYNRRVVMRDGTAKTHGTFSDPGALYLEGPIDPEVAVLAARAADGALLGCLVNFACHPTHHGGGAALSAGFPGVLAREMAAAGCPVTLFLNGACGNTHTSDPASGTATDMEVAGQRLAAAAQRALASATFAAEAALAARRTTVSLPYRAVTDDEVQGTVFGAQRFVRPSAYDDGMPALLERIRTREVQPAEVQVLSINDHDFVSIPAEYFVEHGLRIKAASHPRRALVVSCANGMVGYLPTRAAFTRGGYETTFYHSSRMAPEAGDLLADTAIALIRDERSPG